MSGLLGLLGLGFRGRRIVVGVDAVRKELQGGKIWCVVVAEDASPRAVAIGAQLGKPPVMAVGVRDRALADGMVPLAPVRP
jgi:hypothetical protein